MGDGDTCSHDEGLETYCDEEFHHNTCLRCGSQWSDSCPLRGTWPPGADGERISVAEDGP